LKFYEAESPNSLISTYALTKSAKAG